MIILSPPKHPRKDQRSYNGGVTFDDEFRGMDIQLTPRDLLVRDSARIGSEGCGRIGDLTKIAPERYVVPLQVLIHHRDHADRKVPRDPAADLEETDPFSAAVLPVPPGQPGHIFDPVLHRTRLQLALYHIACKNIARSAVLPAGNDNRNVLL